MVKPQALDACPAEEQPTTRHLHCIHLDEGPFLVGDDLHQPGANVGFCAIVCGVQLV